MKSRILPIVAVFAGTPLCGCSEPRTLRDDDLATMMYRDCMNAASPSWSMDDASSAMSDSNTRNTASFDAAAERKREQRQQMACMEQAGYEDD